MYPRHLLTHHFWTAQQRIDFAVMNIRDRISHNRSIFRLLQGKLSQIKNDVNYAPWENILGKLGSGAHPTVDEILNIKSLFAEVPYKTSSLSYVHIVSFFQFRNHFPVYTIYFAFFTLAETFMWPTRYQVDIF